MQIYYICMFEHYVYLTARILLKIWVLIRYENMFKDKSCSSLIKLHILFS